jgi:hypothetical protein
VGGWPSCRIADVGLQNCGSRHLSCQRGRPAAACTLLWRTEHCTTAAGGGDTVGVVIVFLCLNVALIMACHRCQCSKS